MVSTTSDCDAARHEQHSSPTGRRPMPSGQMSIVQKAEAHASTVGGGGRTPRRQPTDTATRSESKRIPSALPLT
eukprot:scaffold72072_cov43-Phaeocystis_antarctica.AAC.1